MRLLVGSTLTILIVLASSTPSQACCGHRTRCHMHRQVCRTTAVAPTYYQPTALMASPQAMTSSPTPMVATAAAAPAVAPVAPVAAAAGVQPTYNYSAGATGQPAYYYTYDSSGKLIIAQWMDWVFRGGRAAGEPAPPLPIIGALRNR